MKDQYFKQLMSAKSITEFNHVFTAEALSGAEPLSPEQIDRSKQHLEFLYMKTSITKQIKYSSCIEDLINACEIFAKQRGMINR